ncbi:hypothetical protein SISNIDRAFT_460778 [Sistotremastrum niveocremeum HHB9708]|uniref:Uncharacterized protein n=1 Tax=Sistotremastrum niveocremeum HHB9708 TaxID=1314777 RepID=A0A164N9P1_9AGAM|nr:hypothetical protein SISNIDRAFT_460778 [Sistotremastrum niveocremeum HHB9708]
MEATPPDGVPAPPSLLLSEIMRHMSASPHPQPPTENADEDYSEPLESADIENMQKRAKELSSSNQELSDMVIRLSSSLGLFQTQLLSQADTINHLSSQRDFLTSMHQEEKVRWESERDSWLRTGEVLIGRAAASEGGKAREQYLEHLVGISQMENSLLRSKISENNSRIKALESDLAQLKPLLLMQPFALVHSHPTDSSTSASNSKQHGKRKDYYDRSLESEEEMHSSPGMLEDPVRPRSDYYRHRSPAGGTPSKPPKNLAAAQTPASSALKPSAIASKKPRVLSADARAEHLLLAARKIGRERASMLSGTFHHNAYTALQGASLQGSSHSAAPPTPRTTMSQQNPSSQANSSLSPAVFGPISVPGMSRPYFLNSSPRTPRASTRSTALSPVTTLTPQGASANTPRTDYYPKVHTYPPLPSASGSNSASNIPRTPSRSKNKTGTPSALESLLSAAQSMLSSPPTPTTRRQSKRRRVEASPKPTTVKKGKEKERPPTPEEEEEDASATDTHDEGSVSGARVMSALDVLADQAAVFSHPHRSDVENDHPERPPPDPDPDPATNNDSVPESQANNETEIDATRDPFPGQDSPTDLDAEFSPVDDVDQVEEEPSRADELISMQLDSAGLETNNPNVSLDPDRTPASHHSSRRNTPKRSSSKHTTPPPDIAPHPDIASPLKPPIDLQTPAEHLSANSTPLPVKPNYSHYPRYRLSQSDITLFPSDSSVPAASMGIVAYGGSATALTQMPTTETSFIHHEPSTPRRIRSPYTKWTTEEDQLLAKAVAKHGQKWDLVQKELPNRGYHQVRQRWLRKLGVYDTKTENSHTANGSASQSSLGSPSPSSAVFTGQFSVEPISPQNLTLSSTHGSSTSGPSLGLMPFNLESTASPLANGHNGHALGPTILSLQDPP